MLFDKLYTQEYLIKKLLGTLIFLISSLSFSQVKTTSVSQAYKNDTTSLYEMVLLADSYGDEYPDSALYLNNLVLKLISENKSQTPSVKERLEQIKGYALISIGYVKEVYNDIPNAIIKYEQSLKTFKAISDRRGEAMALNNLAQIFESTGDTNVAFRYYQQSLKLLRLVKDKQSEAAALNNIAKIYKDKKQYDTAMQFFYKSLAIRRSLNDTAGIANSLNNLGTVYFVMGNFTEAERYFNESIPLREKVSDVSGLASSIVNLGYLYLRDGKKKEALKMANKVMELSLRLNQPAKIKSAALLLCSVYKKMGDAEKALINYKLFVRTNDSLNAEANKKASIKSQLKYEYEKKATADSVRVVEERKVVAAQLKQEKTQRYSLSFGLILVVLFALFMINRFRVTNKQKKIIEEQKKTVELQKGIVEEKQKEVLDSIHYAKRIQLSLLPQEKYIDKQLRKLND